MCKLCFYAFSGFRGFIGSFIVHSSLLVTLHYVCVQILHYTVMYSLMKLSDNPHKLIIQVIVCLCRVHLLPETWVADTLKLMFVLKVLMCTVSVFSQCPKCNFAWSEMRSFADPLCFLFQAVCLDSHFIVPHPISLSHAKWLTLEWVFSQIKHWSSSPFQLPLTLNCTDSGGQLRLLLI